MGWNTWLYPLKLNIFQFYLNGKALLGLSRFFFVFRIGGTKSRLFRSFPRSFRSLVLLLNATMPINSAEGTNNL